MSYKKIQLCVQHWSQNMILCYVSALQIFTSKMAADMPSETELFTTAKHRFMAAWSSCWLLSWAKKTPAALQKQRQSSVLRDSGLTEVWMMLKESDKLRAGNTAALYGTCTESPGELLTREGSFLPQSFVVLKALGEKLKDQQGLESGRTD